MFITLMGHNHVHSADFIGEYPDGSNGYLGLVIRSKAVIILDEKEIPVLPGTIIIYEKMKPRCYRANGEPFINDWFVFSLEDNDIEFLKALEIPLNEPISLSDVNLFSKLIANMLYEKYHGGDFKEDVINCYLKIFFLKLNEATAERRINTPSSLQDKMNMVRSKIHNLPYTKFKVDILAKEATISTAYFQHLYKQMFGISPVNDIINARISYAEEFLEFSEMPISSVAECCGYENEVHFMRQFKKKTGLTPSEFRRMKKLS